MKAVWLEVENVVIESGDWQLPDQLTIAQKTGAALRRLVERHGAPCGLAERGRGEPTVTLRMAVTGDSAALLADALAQSLYSALEERD